MKLSRDGTVRSVSTTVEQGSKQPYLDSWKRDLLSRSDEAAVHLYKWKAVGNTLVTTVDGGTDIRTPEAGGVWDLEVRLNYMSPAHYKERCDTV